MNSTLIYQVLTSFIAGGCFIALLTLLAEKANEKVAGIILMFPATIVLGYFFLGIATSAEKVAEIVPATLAPLGVVIFSSVIYITVAKAFASIRHRVLRSVVTLIAGSVLWFILVAPFAIWKINNLLLGTIGYILFTLLAHYLLNKPSRTYDPVSVSYSRLQIALRALFMGTVIAMVVLMGKLLGPFWGGIFTMYPAVTFVALTTFQYYYPADQLYSFFKRAPLGSTTLFLYAISSMLLFPPLGTVVGTVISYLISLVYSLALIRFQKRYVKPRGS